MNQTRVFLIFAWLMVATLLWMEWGKEKAAPPAQAQTVAAAAAPDGSIPSNASAPGAIPAAPTTGASTPTTAATPAASPSVTVTTDVLKLVLDGGEMRQADLLRYPSTADDSSAPVRLFATDPANYFVAQSGWVSQGGQAPTHQAGFVPEGGKTDFTLADGANSIDVPFVWTGSDGVTIRRTYTFTRSNYVVQVRDEVINAGAKPWQGFVYRQLSRVPRALVKKGPMSAEQYSFQGAAWYSNADKYEKRKYDAFVEDGSLDKQVTGGWIGMLQHHFFAAWIPGSNDTTTFSLATPSGTGGTQYLIREVGPGVTVAPGATAETSARLWVGPKLVKAIEVQRCRAWTARSTSAATASWPPSPAGCSGCLRRSMAWSATGAGRSSAWCS
jgi:YidC/Oxa1 family membrane protein insertase